MDVRFELLCASLSMERPKGAPDSERAFEILSLPTPPL